MNDNLHQLRCFGCGARISGAEAQPDFRCVRCGDLFEVEYPVGVSAAAMTVLIPARSNGSGESGAAPPKR